MCVRGVCASCCCPIYQLFIKDCLVGNDLLQYRAAIGAFYAVTHKLIRASEFKLNLLFLLYCAINICCILSLRCVIKNDEFTLYRLILLIICMDIHLNPGPASDTINSLDILHLNIRSIRNKIDYISEFSDTHVWHVKRCIIRYFHIIILSYLFIFKKYIFLFYQSLLLLYISLFIFNIRSFLLHIFHLYSIFYHLYFIIFITILSFFISIIYFNICILCLAILFLDVILLFYLPLFLFYTDAYLYSISFPFLF